MWCETHRTASPAYQMHAGCPFAFGAPVPARYAPLDHCPWSFQIDPFEKTGYEAISSGKTLIHLSEISSPTLSRHPLPRGSVTVSMSSCIVKLAICASASECPVTVS